VPIQSCCQQECRVRYLVVVGTRGAAKYQERKMRTRGPVSENLKDLSHAGCEQFVETFRRKFTDVHE